MAAFKRGLALLLALALCVPLAGCEKEPEAVQTTIFAMDTVMNLTVYGKQEALDGAVAIIYDLERQYSISDPNSSVYALNHAGGAATQLSQNTVELLQGALLLCQITDGALDLTAYPATWAWGFPSGEYRVPGQEELDRLAAAIDFTALELDPLSNNASLPVGMELDLGAVAKGHAGDFLAEHLKLNGVTSALLDLGQSSIQAIGSKPDGSPWRVGIQDPAGDGYLGVLEIADQGVGTSGSYQRFFEEDGVRYCHIIDPDTAAPAQSGLASVTVVSPSGLVCDGLSTALFVMGLEEGAALWNYLRADPHLAFEAIFIEENGDITITAGMKDSFSLQSGYKDREVTVLE